MYIVVWLLFGGFIGWVASVLTRDNFRMGLLANIIVGLVGAFIGGILTQLLGIASVNVFSWQGFVFSVLGAVILLILINLFNRRRI